MSERYFITGVQLGLLKSEHMTQARKDKLVDGIVDEQHITNCYTPEKQAEFKKLMIYVNTLISD